MRSSDTLAAQLSRLDPNMTHIRENLFYKDTERNWSTKSRPLTLKREVKETVPWNSEVRGQSLGTTCRLPGHYPLFLLCGITLMANVNPLACTLYHFLLSNQIFSLNCSI